jgi:ubiquinone/menaquinone biosynthesis C-methylase UbiE
MTDKSLKGTEVTKEFYNREGWHKCDGKTFDSELFGVKENGPIRVELHNVHQQRIRSAISGAGDEISLLECGCGGNPETMFLDLCSRYTGVDFSEKGLEIAESKFEKVAIPYQFEVADICKLTFEDEQFDAVYSAHMLYHIEEPLAQKVALKEMLRVVRANGVVVLIVANPRPLLFPIRFIKRFISDLPVIGLIANRIRPKPPLPYKPMSLGWMRHQLTPYGSVEIITSGLPSTYFNQHISEYNVIGKKLWSFLKWLELKTPKISAYLGNYVQITVVKTS